MMKQITAWQFFMTLVSLKRVNLAQPIQRVYRTLSSYQALSKHHIQLMFQTKQHESFSPNQQTKQHVYREPLPTGNLSERQRVCNLPCSVAYLLPQLNTLPNQVQPDATTAPNVGTVLVLNCNIPVMYVLCVLCIWPLCATWPCLAQRVAGEGAGAGGWHRVGIGIGNRDWDNE